MRRQELHPRTAIVNKAQKNQSKLAKNKALAWLIKTFPKAFDTSLSIQPLKIGIMEDILIHAMQAHEAGISRSKLREAVVLFTRRIDYLACVKAREMRINLEGHAVAQVSDDDAEKAAIKLRKKVEKSARARQQSLEQSNELLANAKTKSSASLLASLPLNQDNPHYIERPPSFNSLNANLAAPSKPTAVIVKSSRQYDPDAVARLKEKLGLSRKAERDKETSE